MIATTHLCAEMVVLVEALVVSEALHVRLRLLTAHLPVVHVAVGRMVWVLGERGDPHRAVHLDAVVTQARVPRAAECLPSRIKDGAL